MSCSNTLAEDAKTSLFKIITVKDEIVVGLSKADAEQLNGNDITAIGRALVKNGELTVWQYAVRKNKAGFLEQAPLRRISVIHSEALRVEPYLSPLAVAPVE